MAQGIYQWTVQRPGKSPLVYVGQSVRIEVRQREYVAAWGKAEDQDPNNVILRRTVLKYGVSAVKFDIIDPDVQTDRLTERERYWFWRRIEELGRENVANHIEPGENPMNDPAARERQLEGSRRRAQDPEWRANSAAAAVARAKHYVFRDPDGNRVEVHNLYAFCQDNRLNVGNMSSVHSGRVRQHKGWTRE